MDIKKLNINIFIIAFVAMIAVSGAGAASLQVYLPRNAVVNGELVRLSDVGVLKGDEKAIAVAGQITLCRVTRVGTEITIDKQTVMSRLASNGINALNVAFSGSDSVVITRKGFIITSEDFIKAAQKELAKEPNNSFCRWKAAWPPKEAAVEGTGEGTKLTAQLMPSQSQNRANVLVSVMQNDSKIFDREVVFDIRYKNVRAIATKDIQLGTLISPDNVRIETFESSLPQHGWAQPYGLATRRQIRAGDIVGADILESAKSPILISRNQGVVIQIRQPGLTITAMGQALDDGRVKECIKVRNIDSQRVLLAKVNEDGTVEPVY